MTGLYWDYICYIGNVNSHIKNLAKRWLCAFNVRTNLMSKQQKEKGAMKSENIVKSKFSVSGCHVRRSHGVPNNLKS